MFQQILTLITLQYWSVQTFQYPCLWVDGVSFGATNFAYFSKGHDLTACSLNMPFCIQNTTRSTCCFVVVSRAFCHHHERVSPSKFWRAYFPPKQNRRFVNQTPPPPPPGIRALPGQLTICRKISVENFWQMVLDLKTFPKIGMGYSCTICKTPGWMVQKISVVSVKMGKR